MPGNEKNRAVIILHPTFDAGGSAGILEAKDFAEKFIESQKELIRQVEKTQSPQVTNELRSYVSRLRVIVRNLPKEVL